MLTVRGQRKQCGLSLVELMVGLAVGLIIVSGLIGVFVSVLRGSTDTLRTTRLNQEVRAAMEIMVSDIRRAGHCFDQASNQPCVANPFMDAGTDIAIAGTCILYNYDAPAPVDGLTDGVLQPATESFGFRLDGSVIRMRASESGCNGDDWPALTDPNSVTVTALTFTTAGSQCLNVDLDSNADGTNDNWERGAGATGRACDAPTETPPSGNTPVTGNQLVELRQIGITLSATHRDDPSIVISVSDEIRVQNNRIVTWP